MVGHIPPGPRRRLMVSKARLRYVYLRSVQTISESGGRAMSASTHPGRPESGADPDGVRPVASESLLLAAKRTLEMIAAGASLGDTLTAVCAAIDAQSPDITSTVLLAAFALYYGEPRSPTGDDLRLIEEAAQLALIAIEAERSRAALQKAGQEA